MDEARLKAILESLLFAAGEPVPLGRLAGVLDTVSHEELASALSMLGADYAHGERGITLEEVAGGYQLRTRKEFAAYVRKLLAARPPRLTRPLLETLAIVAYRQPVTRHEIEALRGVDCEGVLDTLLERRLVRIAGRKDAAGRPIIYATTTQFLEVFGLRDLDSLPDLAEFQEIDRARREAEAPGTAETTEAPDAPADRLEPAEPGGQQATSDAGAAPSSSDEQSQALAEGPVNPGSSEPDDGADS